MGACAAQALMGDCGYVLRFVRTSAAMGQPASQPRLAMAMTLISGTHPRQDPHQR